MLRRRALRELRAHERLRVLGDVEVRRAEAVPLDHRELGIVPRAELPLAEARADLVYPVHPGGEELLHLQLRRGAQEGVAARRTVDVRLRGGRGDPYRRRDLGESARVEEAAHAAQDRRARLQVLHKTFQPFSLSASNFKLQTLNFKL